jgi:hypothetical protein
MSISTIPNQDLYELALSLYTVHYGTKNLICIVLSLSSLGMY